jgi:hypothetical protein
MCSPLAQLPAAPQPDATDTEEDLGADEFDALMSAAKRAKADAAAFPAAAPSPLPLPPPPPPPPPGDLEQPRHGRRARRSFPASLARAAARISGGEGADLSTEVAFAAAAPAPSSSAPPAPAPAAAAAHPSAAGAPPAASGGGGGDGPALTYRGAMRYARTPREAEAAALAVLKALGCDGDEDGGGGQGGAAAAAAAATAAAPAAAAAAGRSLAVGFDVEWTATFRRGQPPGRVALVQICYENPAAAGTAAAAADEAGVRQPAAAAAPGQQQRQQQQQPPPQPPPPPPPPPCGRGTCAVALFHVAHCGVPPALGRLLSDPRVLKVGVGARADARKLAADWPGAADAWPLADLGGEAARRGLLPPPAGGSSSNGGGGGGGGGGATTTTVWSLAGLAREVLPGRPRLPKPQALRTGGWDAAPLSAAQRQYAAADAFASLAVWRALERVAPLPTASQEGLAALARMHEEERTLPPYMAVGRAAAATGGAAAASAATGGAASAAAPAPGGE